uniref:Uncharacterized protein n=1 Tax=Jatropha curcas TaxID=180498 RepID=E2CXG0_JATCU|nr:hypothetical protein [Jatropha curcas]
MALALSSQNGVLRPPVPLSSRRPIQPAVTLFFPVQEPLKSFSIPFDNPKKPLCFYTKQHSRLRVLASLSSQSSQITTLSPSTESQPLLTGSTRTITTILTLAFSLSRVFLTSIQKFAVSVAGASFFPNLNGLATIRGLQGDLVNSVGPLFFASLKDRPSGYLNTPLTVVAAGLAKWLDIYSGGFDG